MTLTDAAIAYTQAFKSYEKAQLAFNEFERLVDKHRIVTIYGITIDLTETHVKEAIQREYTESVLTPLYNASEEAHNILKMAAREQSNDKNI